MMFSQPILIVIIIVIIFIFTEPPCQRIDCESVGVSVLGAHRHDKPPASYHLNICPSISDQFLPDLIFGHGSAALYEHRAGVALWCRDYEGGGSGKQHSTCNRPYDSWFHGNLLGPCYLLTVGASEAFTV